MCGIVGLVGEPNSALSAGAVWRMGAAVARRGPDDEGYESWPGATLGHRRLSIFDLSPAGHQPMVSRDGFTALLFNGEIYDALEQRAVLERDGYQFLTATDTEVVLALYEREGLERMLERLDGMFAIVIADTRLLSKTGGKQDFTRAPAT